MGIFQSDIRNSLETTDVNDEPLVDNGVWQKPIRFVFKIFTVFLHQDVFGQESVGRAASVDEIRVRRVDFW